MQTVVTPLINSSLYLLIFGVSLGSNIHLKSGLSYLYFLIPGVVMMSVLNNAFQNSSSSVIVGKFSGELEDLRVVPLSVPEIALAMGLAALIRGATVGVVTLAVGEVFCFITDHQWMMMAHPLHLLFFLIVGGMAFSQLGISVAFWAKSFDQISAVGAFVLLPLLYLGGVFFSLENLHPFWQTLSHFNPILYLINGVRYGMVGVTDVDLTQAAVISLLFMAALYYTALRSLRNGSYLRW